MKLSKLLLKVGIDIRRKLFKEILDQLGGNLRYVISGASHVDITVTDIFHFKHGIDIGSNVVLGQLYRRFCRISQIAD